MASARSTPVGRAVCPNVCGGAATCHLVPSSLVDDRPPRRSTQTAMPRPWTAAKARFPSVAVELRGWVGPRLAGVAAARLDCFEVLVGRRGNKLVA